MKLCLSPAGTLGAAVLMAGALHAADDLLIAGFEGDTYGAWVATGEAFGPGPARGTLPGQMHVARLQTDRRPPGFLPDVTRTFEIQKRHLNLPVKNGAPKRVVTTLVEEEVIVRNHIELADAEPDWWAFMDVGPWRGRYDGKAQEWVVNGNRAPAPLRNGRQCLAIFCDRTGLEVFASHGLTYVPMPFQPKAEDLALGVQVKGGSAKLTTLRVHELESAWTPRSP